MSVRLPPCSATRLRQAYRTIADWHHVCLMENGDLKHHGELTWVGGSWLCELTSRGESSGFEGSALSEDPCKAVIVATSRWHVEFGHWRKARMAEKAGLSDG